VVGALVHAREVALDDEAGLQLEAADAGERQGVEVFQWVVFHRWQRVGVMGCRRFVARRIGFHPVCCRTGWNPILRAAKRVHAVGSTGGVPTVATGTVVETRPRASCSSFGSRGIMSVRRRMMSSGLMFC